MVDEKPDIQIINKEESIISKKIKNRRIFVVHGQNEEIKNQVDK